MKYRPTIGLEIHAELKTRTKMFCDSKNDPDEERPNVNICPVCMAHPGTLPVINKAAVKHVLKLGVAVNGTLADYTEFDRKNYFYPDIPKGYQISQYKYPLISGGSLLGVEITRVHLEEDTARSTHTGESSLVDFNRAGIPLMELVTEPVIHDAETAQNFARELRLLLRYLGAGDANMEKGEMRVEANISISDSDKLGTKVEVKNLNSFRSVGDAIRFEIKRQAELLDSGERVVQETRGWDENKQVTFSQRMKEESHDYRYFPDPDLPKLIISEIPEFSREALKRELPELPEEKRSRYGELDVPHDVIETFVREPLLSEFYDEVVGLIGDIAGGKKTAAHYITSNILGIIKGDFSLFENKNTLTPDNFASLVRLVSENKISSHAAKEILEVLILSGGDTESIANERGLLQESSEDVLNEIVQTVINENENVARDYQEGKESALQYLVGQGMKATRGSANPQVLSELLKKKLS